MHDKTMKKTVRFTSLSFFVSNFRIRKKPSMTRRLFLLTIGWGKKRIDWGM